MTEHQAAHQPDDPGRSLDRRAGPRRVAAEGPVDYERRQHGDRRRKKPGLAALFGAIVAGIDKPRAKHTTPSAKS